eukprot:CAMPEP_0172829544 /NCGR_PEP_ID=MMETSP1075-20121228/21605_1 /TAXON_ID=2916 /ORGANISM="Ceratium fusus, Strain PA161109" /LENGTH=567 /DNA_ID=CAMNT_0013671697 /DNA_START=33 /DNA_END=1736 /DNA_ORIENTATION=+
MTSLVLLMITFAMVGGNVFLQRSEFQGALPIDGHILMQLEEAMGSEHRVATEPRMKSITEALNSIFVALPKNNTGKVGPTSARYALHRLFVQRHGWQVKGLAANGETWDAAHPSTAFADKVSSEVRSLFDDRLRNAGLDLHELVVFAATLEHLIHSEAMTRLHAAYRLSSEEPMKSLPKQKADGLIQTYMAIYVTGLNASATSEANMQHYVTNIRKIYPGWEHTVKFLEHLQDEVVGDRPVYEFSDITNVVEEAGERFGRFQNQECLDLKKTLVALEESSGSGRVRLADFYGSALNAGQWQFSESVEYLRQLGALDESDSSNLRIMIPNYLNAPSNCIASSAYYGVCCIDECEKILGHVEKKVRGPTAHPTEIANIIVNLPSASVAAGRKLSATLMQRLTELGDHHGNRIPIHGRLFAQWMHLAYPRECPFPHVSGTIQPKTAKEMKAAGQAIKAQKKVMQQYVKAGQKSNKGEEGCNNEICSAIWSTEEELVDSHAHSSVVARREGRGPWRTLLFLIFTCTTAISLALSLLRTLGTISETVEVNTKTQFAIWPRASLKQTINVHNV